MVSENSGLGVPASLSPHELDKLVDLVIAKLAAQQGGNLPSRQAVAGSNPVSRSIPFYEYFPGGIR